MTADLDTRLTTSARDFGLLTLRIGVGATMLQAGLRKFVDFDTTTGFMESGGWSAPTLAAFMVSFAETVGGLGLVLGLLTPLAAMAVVAAMIDAWLVNVSGAAFWSDPFNLPFVLGFGAAALLFTGAGSIRWTSACGDAPPGPTGCCHAAGVGDRCRGGHLGRAQRHQPDPLHGPRQLAKSAPTWGHRDADTTGR